MKTVIKIVKKCLDIFCWILIAALTLTIVMSFVARINGTNPTVFGYSVFRVSSGSMEPELSIGDVILGKVVVDPTELQVGDVVTYKGSGHMGGNLITHEVIVAPCEEDGVVKLQTKGVANDIPDDPIEVDRVVSVMVCELPFLNVFYSFFFSPWGLLTIVALIVFVFIDELIVFIKNATGKKSAKDGEDINEIIERLQAESAQQAKDDDDSQSLPKE